MKWSYVFVFCMFASLVLASCANDPSRIHSPEIPFLDLKWTKEERAKDSAMKTLRTTEHASYHLVRVATAEEPHTHSEDLTAFVLEGKAMLHVAGNMTKIEKGDVVSIPKDTLHWAEKRGKTPVEVYTIFTPPLSE